MVIVSAAPWFLLVTGRVGKLFSQWVTGQGCVGILDCLHLNPDTHCRRDWDEVEQYPRDAAKDHFCHMSGWCFLFVSGSTQSTRFGWEKNFLPWKSDLRGTSAVPVYRKDSAIECVWGSGSVLSNTLLAFPKVLQVADVFACGTWCFQLLRVEML